MLSSWNPKRREIFVVYHFIFPITALADPPRMFLDPHGVNLRVREGDTLISLGLDQHQVVAHMPFCTWAYWMTVRQRFDTLSFLYI